ncbi:hypothetical protein GW17_00025394, partial [Ensete ventricosum]
SSEPKRHHYKGGGEMGGGRERGVLSGFLFHASPWAVVFPCREGSPSYLSLSLSLAVVLLLVASGRVEIIELWVRDGGTFPPSIPRRWNKEPCRDLSSKPACVLLGVLGVQAFPGWKSQRLRSTSMVMPMQRKELTGALSLRSPVSLSELKKDPYKDFKKCILREEIELEEEEEDKANRYDTDKESSRHGGHAGGRRRATILYTTDRVLSLAHTSRARHTKPLSRWSGGEAGGLPASSTMETWRWRTKTALLGRISKES